MGQTTRGRQTNPWVDDGTGRSETEFALHQGAVLLGGALIGLVHTIDTVLEAWPLPTSRTRHPAAHSAVSPEARAEPPPRA